MLDIDYQLAASQPHALRDAVRALLANPAAEVIDFRATPLAEGAGNPTSAGLWRLSGFARSSSDVVEWTLVVKAVTLPTETTFDHNDPRFLNYWRREINIFCSPILSELPTGLGAPSFFGSAELDLPQAHALLFMEDLGAISRDAWDVDAYVFAAQRIAKWERSVLSAAAQPNDEWLTRDVSRQWVRIARTYFNRFLSLAGAGHQPLAAFNLETCQGSFRPLLQTIYDPESLLAALDLLPLVLCHNDANIDNLLIRPLDDSVAALIVFDVQWVGFSGVGTELGQLLCNVPTMTEGITRHRVETRVIDAYLAELNADGADITRDQVEFGYSASACLRQFHFGVALAAEGLDAALDAGDDRRVREIAEAFVAGVLNGPLPRLAARAIELIPTVEGR